jgi:hypothetical protein
MDELLHVLRVKGRATIEDLATLLASDPTSTLVRLRDLESRDLAVERSAGGSPGWMLSPTGRDEHARELREETTAAMRGCLTEAANRFRRVDARTEAALATWQAAIDGGRREALLSELREVYADAAWVLARAAEAVPRFAGYRDRLGRALESAEHDSRYIVDPSRDSYQTVWSECQEDFLVTLGSDHHQRDAW